MLLAFLSFFGLFSAQYIANLEITPLAFDGAAFKAAFNNAADKGRLVAVMSPT